MKTRQLLVPLTLGLGLLWVLSGGLSVRADPGNVYCVDPGGGSYPDECTEVFTNVQAAVDAASGGEEIRVAGGVYTGVHQRESITQVVFISKTVTVRGGYTSTDGFAGPPDSVANPTTLDAQGLGRVLVIVGDPWTSSGQTVTPTLEGLRITGGNATRLYGAGYDAGGGVYVYLATATISGCVVTGNTASTASTGAGGGLYLSHSDVMLQDNVIVSNTASTAAVGYGGYGGGLYLSNSAATLQDNTVQGNTASTASWGEGGGLLLSSSAATLQGNTVVSNTASTGGIGLGGGLLLSSSAATLQDNTVQGNTASTDGVGGHGGYGGGLYLLSSAATLQDNTVQGNTASTASEGEGGGLHLYLSAATLESNTIVSNTATLSPTAIGRGGGLYVNWSDPFTLTNNLVAGNHANTAGTGHGSGLGFAGSSSNPASGRLLHNTIADNHEEGVFVGGYTTLAFTNTIIAGHSVGIAVTANSMVELDATLWHGNGTNTGGVGAILTGTVNVYGDPAFANPAAWDYHLGPGSVAIDAGMDAGVPVDIDGDPRLGSHDIGADEFVKRVYLPSTLRNWWLFRP